jgi:hypothetical protein
MQSLFLKGFNNIYESKHMILPTKAPQYWLILAYDESTLLPITHYKPTRLVHGISKIFLQMENRI